MTEAEWTAEVDRRIGISEGRRATMYYDSLGVRTIGQGFNLQRADAMNALERAGVPASQIGGVLVGTVALTESQIDALFAYSLAPVLSEARASLDPGTFDALSDARRFVVVDLVYNLGAAGWNEFAQTRSLIAQAQSAKTAGAPNAHDLFVEVGDHLAGSAWYHQVGNRARRDIAMMEVGVWCDPTGNGSDIL